MKYSGATERLALVRQVAAAAPALLFGSVALEIAYPSLLDHEPPDVDFLVPVASVAPIVAAVDHTWTSWEEPVDLAKLAGRFYVRGRHASRPTIDLTYESPVRWDEAWARRIEHEGIAIAAAEDLACVYEARGRPGDEKLARLLRLRNLESIG